MQEEVCAEERQVAGNEKIEFCTRKQEARINTSQRTTAGDLVRQEITASVDCFSALSNDDHAIANPAEHATLTVEQRFPAQSEMRFRPAHAPAFTTRKNESRNELSSTLHLRPRNAKGVWRVMARPLISKSVSALTRHSTMRRSSPVRRKLPSFPNAGK